MVEDPLEAPDRPEVKLDPLNMGLDAVIVKNGSRLCGTGGVIANAPIMQDKAYFEGESFFNPKFFLQRVPIRPLFMKSIGIRT